MSNEVAVNFLTLNCWGIPYVSRHRNARMIAIADKFVSGEYDIVCLQEVWSINDFRLIKTKAQEHLCYSHYFHSGVLGSGICILSRYPIENVMFHKWSLNGYVHKIHHGDWFGGKGIGVCRLRIQGMSVNVYVAHLHAEYNHDNDEYTAHRVLQAYDTAQFIRMTSGGVDAVILGGDLNTEPQDLAYKIICGVAGLTDACSSGTSTLGTNECANNSYTSSKVARDIPEGKRIDHILYLGSSKIKVEVTNFEHPFPKRVPYKNFSYSDHEAVMATFKFTTGEHPAQDIEVKQSLKEAVSVCESALKSVRRERLWYFLIGLLLFTLVVCSMSVDTFTTSIGVIIGLNVLRIFLTALLCYAFFMSTIWNSIEKNALKAGCLAMEIHMDYLNNNPKKK